MFPFTQEMFQIYQKYKNNDEVIKNDFEYNFAISQFVCEDEPTMSDRNEMNYLLDRLKRSFSNDHEYELYYAFKNAVVYE